MSRTRAEGAVHMRPEQLILHKLSGASIAPIADSYHGKLYSGLPHQPQAPVQTVEKQADIL